jgi:hypothetical protein
MKRDLRAISAVGMLVAGVGLSVAGFCVSPVGEISDSVLWFFAQCLLYAGSALGLDVFIERKINERQKK